jgi:hypothetical protein
MSALTGLEPSEYAAFHAPYIAALGGRDVSELLPAQIEAIEAFAALPAEQLEHRYAPGKWTVREIIGHLIDAERVLSYRLLCFARGETKDLPGFDEGDYAAVSNAGRRAVTDLVDELKAVRTSTLALVRSLDQGVMTRVGRANGWNISVRAMVHIIAGHFEHHLDVLESRYRIALPRRERRSPPPDGA